MVNKDFSGFFDAAGGRQVRAGGVVDHDHAGRSDDA